MVVSPSVIKDVLAQVEKIIGPSPEQYRTVQPMRVTRPCTKLRYGTCPIVLANALDCNKRRRVGCPILGLDGKIDIRRVQFFLSQPQILGNWLLLGLYGPQGVNGA